MSGEPPAFPDLNRQRYPSHLRADGADDRTEGIPGQNPERNPAHSAHDLEEIAPAGRNNSFICASPCRGRTLVTFRTPPGEENSAFPMPACGRGTQAKTEIPFSGSGITFCGRIFQDSLGKPGRAVADIPGHPKRKTCAPQAKEQKRDESFRADVASAVLLHSSSVAHFFP